MFNQKPIWCPNVLLLSIDNSKQFTENEASQIVAKLGKQQRFVTVYLSDEKRGIDETQIVIKYDDYAIYKETRHESSNLASTYVKLGSKYVYYIVIKGNNYRAAFAHIFDILGIDLPIICVSANLLEQLNPAAVIYANNDVEGFSNDNQSSNGQQFQTKTFISQKVQFIDKKIIVDRL